MPTLETTHFLLTLADDWQPVESDDPDRFIFESDRRDTSLTLSTMRMEAAFEDLPGIADSFVQSRIDAHYTNAQEHGWLFEMAEPQVFDREFGQVVVYHGRLMAGGQFGFTGLVLPTGVISIFVESDTASEHALSETLSEIAGGMEI